MEQPFREHQQQQHHLHFMTIKPSLNQQQLWPSIQEKHQHQQQHLLRIQFIDHQQHQQHSSLPHHQQEHSEQHHLQQQLRLQA